MNSPGFWSIARAMQNEKHTNTDHAYDVKDISAVLFGITWYHFRANNEVKEGNRSPPHCIRVI